jgi:flagellin
MIDDAIAYVVQHRAALGANNNRLSSAISNLTTLSNNKQASLGTVADADMATEVTQLAKSQLLAQASVAMTAKANASMYEVLKLIKD